MSALQRSESSASGRSIYTRSSPVAPVNRRTRDEKRRRARARQLDTIDGRPSIVLDRASAIQAILQTTRRYGPKPDCLGELVAAVEDELKPLERWAGTRSQAEREDGPTTRRALEYLRILGRMSTLDFSLLPDEARPSLVRWLALEHRWCYAAAGTDRLSFKNATGRTGAR